MDETDRRLYFDPPLLPSPYGWRFGVHDWHFRGLLDNSLHVVARKLARPPKAAFSHRRLPTVCYLPIGFNCFLMDNLLSGVGLTPTGIRQTLARRTPAAPARDALVNNPSSTNTYKIESYSNSTTFGTLGPCSRALKLRFLDILHFPDKEGSYTSENSGMIRLLKDQDQTIRGRSLRCLSCKMLCLESTSFSSPWP